MSRCTQRGTRARGVGPSRNSYCRPRHQPPSARTHCGSRAHTLWVAARRLPLTGLELASSEEAIAPSPLRDVPIFGSMYTVSRIPMSVTRPGVKVSDIERCFGLCASPIACCFLLSLSEDEGRPRLGTVIHYKRQQRSRAGGRAHERCTHTQHTKLRHCSHAH